MLKNRWQFVVILGALLCPVIVGAQTITVQFHCGDCTGDVVLYHEGVEVCTVAAAEVVTESWYRLATCQATLPPARRYRFTMTIGDSGLVSRQYDVIRGQTWAGPATGSATTGRVSNGAVSSGAAR